MLHPDGSIFVPPDCPQGQEGPPIPDLREADFLTSVHATAGGPEPHVEVIASFSVGDQEGYTNYSAVDAGIIEPAGSPLAQQLLRLADIAAGDSADLSHEKPETELVRQALCRRVASCRGVIDGVCWALGDAGFREELVGILRPAPDEA